MTEKQSHLEHSVDQMMAALDGDYSHVSIHEISSQSAPQYSAQEIKAIRKAVDLSQLLLAAVLAVSPRTVKAWETGRSRPSRTACRLLEVIQKDPSVIELLIGD